MTTIRIPNNEPALIDASRERPPGLDITDQEAWVMVWNNMSQKPRRLVELEEQRAQQAEEEAAESL